MVFAGALRVGMAGQFGNSIDCFMRTAASDGNGMVYNSERVSHKLLMMLRRVFETGSAQNGSLPNDDAELFAL